VRETKSYVVLERLRHDPIPSSRPTRPSCSEQKSPRADRCRRFAPGKRFCRLGQLQTHAGSLSQHAVTSASQHAVASAGQRDLSFHDLRHTVNTRCSKPRNQITWLNRSSGCKVLSRGWRAPGDRRLRRGAAAAYSATRRNLSGAPPKYRSFFRASQSSAQLIARRTWIASKNVLAHSVQIVIRSRLPTFPVE
jgi:hypothetical protein